MPAGKIVGRRDHHLGHTGIDGRKGILDLGKHASGDYLPRLQIGEQRGGDNRYHRTVVGTVGQHSGLLEAIHQRDIKQRSQSHGHRRRHSVGIGVEHGSVTVVSERSHHRHHTCTQQRRQRVGIDPLHIANIAVVDSFGRDRTATAAYHVHIGTGHSERIDTTRLQAGHYILVDQASVDHGHDPEHRLVGDTPAAHHHGVDTHGRSHGRGRPSAAVNKQLESVDSGKAVEQRGQRPRLLDYGAADLDNGYAVVHCWSSLPANSMRYALMNPSRSPSITPPTSDVCQPVR